MPLIIGERYISKMRRVLRYLALALCLGVSLAWSAQWNRGENREKDLPRIDESYLLDHTTVVPGVGQSVPGIDLLKKCNSYYWSGTDSAYTARDFNDLHWAEDQDSADSIAPGSSVRWMRLYLLIDPALRDVPLYMNVSCDEVIEVYLNGVLIMRSDDRSAKRWAATGAEDEHVRRTLPVVFTGDGRPEVIAVRMVMDRPADRAPPDLRMTLHTRDIESIVQRSNMHSGVFVGINLIIFLLAIILWSFDRSDTNWLLLASITLVTAFVAFSLAANEWNIGIVPSGRMALLFLGGALYFVPSFLLILLLRRLLGLPPWKRLRLYVLAVSVLAVVITVISVVEELSTDGLSFDTDSVSVPVLIAGVIGAIVLGIAAIGIFMQVIRLGTRLLRSKGYERWIGAGALFSSLSTMFFGMLKSTFNMPDTSWLSTMADYFNYVGVSVSAAVFMAIRSAQHNKVVARQRDDLDQEVHERTAELRKERDRSDELLLNILPYEVAEELKRTGAAAAKHFDRASVLFTDFKGFTTMSENVDAGELLQELNTCFHAFDDIIGARGIEKIKTIGDSFMCAGGLPDPKSSSPSDVVFAALEMQAFMEKRRIEREAQGKLAFVMRVGIHTGPVVAGIVGVKKFQYDIWGDTVNTASRMESSGEVGRVNISANTFALVKDEPGLAFTPRGKVNAKGKGDMEMWYVHRA